MESLNFKRSDDSLNSVDNNGVITALKASSYPVTIDIVVNGIKKSILLASIPNKTVTDVNGNRITLDHYEIFIDNNKLVQENVKEIDILSLISYKAYDHKISLLMQS